VADRDGEDAGGGQDGEVGDQERGEGAEQDRPEAPARQLGAGRLGR
jgi:hypothetical protein